MGFEPHIKRPNLNQETFDKSEVSKIHHKYENFKRTACWQTIKANFTPGWKGKFLDFAKGRPKFEYAKLTDIFKTGRIAALNILKEEKKIETFGKNLRNKIALGKIGKYTKFYAIGTKDIALIISTQFSQCSKNSRTVILGQ